MIASASSNASAMPRRIMGRWGVYSVDTSAAIAEFSGFVDFEYSAEAKVAKQPVEKGGFISANKWSEAFEPKVTLAKEGDASALEAVLNVLEDYRKSTKLVNVVTPYKTYLDVTIIKVNYSHKRENGHGLILFDLKLQEIRQVEAAYTNTPKKAGSSGTQERGKQQPKEPRNSTIYKASKSVGGGS